MNRGSARWPKVWVARSFDTRVRSLPKFGRNCGNAIVVGVVGGMAVLVRPDHLCIADQNQARHSPYVARTLAVAVTLCSGAALRKPHGWTEHLRDRPLFESKAFIELRAWIRDRANAGPVAAQEGAPLRWGPLIEEEGARESVAGCRG